VPQTYVLVVEIIPVIVLFAYVNELIGICEANVISNGAEYPLSS
jgi:hypothetical protein